MLKEIVLAQPRGFCAGVDRAIEIVELVLKNYGPPVYVRHEIVHNTFVVAELKKKGVLFIEDVNDIPLDCTLVLSAHGSSKEVLRVAHERAGVVFNATCPLVTKVHVEVTKLRGLHYDFIMIGHEDHPEVIGTLGQLSSPDGFYVVSSLKEIDQLNPRQSHLLALITQTTLSVDDTKILTLAIQNRFPTIRLPKIQDICYATQNRQDAVKNLCREVDAMIIVGSHFSSNSNRLKDVATSMGLASYLVDNASDVRKEWFENVQRVGVSAGASTPEVVVQEVIQKLHEFCTPNNIRQLSGIHESIKFPLPKGLSRG